MNKKIIDFIFGCIIFALPFKYIPSVLWQTYIGGPFGQDLVVYPIFFGIIYTVYCQWKYKNIGYRWDIFKKFALIYATVLLVSIFWGLINYPYYEWVFNGPKDQLEKLSKILIFFNHIGISDAEELLLRIWLVIRPIKSIFFEMLYTFGATYMIICWYHTRVNDAIKILLKVNTVNLIIIAVYGMVDVFYQNGQEWAQMTLAFLNSNIHANVVVEYIPYEVSTMMFRNLQNRSLFLEPSYFGIYMAFSSPLLWWDIYRRNNNIKRLMLFLLFLLVSFELFLSQSRLALVVNLGVFFLFSLLFMYKLRKKALVFILILLTGGSLAFTGAILFLQYGQVSAPMGGGEPLATKWRVMQVKEDDKVKKGLSNVNTQKYFDEGVSSLSSGYEGEQHAGSNHSRFTVQKTHIQIGLEHPLLGVGTSFRQAFLRDKLDKDPGGEIQIWNKTIDKKGILNRGFPNLGEFTLRFAETGILGLIFYLFPAFILFSLYIKKIIIERINLNSIVPIIFSTASFTGMFVTGLGEGLNITFCYWLAMAIGYLLTLEMK